MIFYKINSFISKINSISENNLNYVITQFKALPAEEKLKLSLEILKYIEVNDIKTIINKLVKHKKRNKEFLQRVTMSPAIHL